MIANYVPKRDLRPNIFNLQFIYLNHKFPQEKWLVSTGLFVS